MSSLGSNVEEQGKGYVPGVGPEGWRMCWWLVRAIENRRILHWRRLIASTIVWITGWALHIVSLRPFWRSRRRGCQTGDIRLWLGMHDFLLLLTVINGHREGLSAKKKQKMRDQWDIFVYQNKYQQLELEKDLHLGIILIIKL